MPQAAEFEITHGSQWVAVLLMFINDVAALEQSATEGLVLMTSCYCDLNDAARVWTEWFQVQRDEPPSIVQAACYSGLRASQQKFRSGWDPSAPVGTIRSEIS